MNDHPPDLPATRALKALALEESSPATTEAALEHLDVVRRSVSPLWFAATILALSTERSVSLGQALSFNIAARSSQPSEEDYSVLVYEFIRRCPVIEDLTVQLNCLGALQSEAFLGRLPLGDPEQSNQLLAFLLDALRSAQPVQDSAIAVLQAIQQQPELASALCCGSWMEVAYELRAIRCTDPAWYGPQVDSLLDWLSSAEPHR